MPLREVIERHDAEMRRHVARFRGRAVKSTGDGFFATFDGPARAIRCAQVRSSIVRSSETGSDRPVPGLSKRMRRENELSRRMKASQRGSVHHRSTCEMKPGTRSRSIGPSPTTW